MSTLVVLELLGVALGELVTLVELVEPELITLPLDFWAFSFMFEEYLPEGW